MGGEIEALKAKMVMMMVGKMPREMMVGMVVMVAVVRDNPCHAQHLEKLNQRGRQEEGQDERMQYAEILAHEPATLLENCWRAPSC
jgi:hypothetical protein